MPRKAQYSVESAKFRRIVTGRSAAIALARRLNREMQPGMGTAVYRIIDTDGIHVTTASSPIMTVGTRNN